MNKKIFLIIIVAVVLLCGAVGVYLLYYNKTDAEKFIIEYPEVGKDNLFVYKTSNEIIEILENGTGVIYFGFPECPWCQSYIPYLNDTAKNVGIKEIYYLNIKEIRSDNTDDYKRIVSLLGDNLLLDENGNHRVYVPDITVVKDGVIIGHNNETSVVSEEDGTPLEYWTEDKVSTLKSELSVMLKKIVPNVCTTCE